VADGNFRRIHKGNSRAFSETDEVEKEHHRHKNLVFYSHKPIVRQCFGKIFFQMNLDIVQIKMLEIGKAAEMIEEQDCYYLAVGHFMPAIAMLFSVADGKLALFSDNLRKFFAKFVY
jgi:hypothetical protein